MKPPDERLQIPFETSFLPPGPYLVFAPHPDDETFGLGGTLALAARKGIKVVVVVMTDGAEGGDPETRMREAMEASRILHLDRMIFRGRKDRTLSSVETDGRDIVDLASALNPGTIFIPSLFEIHPDHKAATQIVRKALLRARKRAEVWGYETITQGRVNRLIDITAVMPVKQEAMSCYQSQEACRPYRDTVTALNRSRAVTLPRDVVYAEAFWRFDGEDSTDAPSFGFPEKEEGPGPELSPPLTSVIVRTFNRPAMLKEALASLAAQTYPHLETIVVNDGGEDVAGIVASFQERLPGIRYLRHESRTGRAAAANTGLAAAAGRWIAFLDDDDRLPPDSFQIRARAMEESKRRVVYGVTECQRFSDASNGEGGLLHTLDYRFAFDPDLLLFQNFIPLNSLLFDRRIFGEYGVFDASFEVFEDWEFLARISRGEKFEFIDRKVAYYRMSSLSTMTGMRFRPEIILSSGERILDRYARNELTFARLQKLIRVLARIQAPEIKEAEARISELAGTISEQDRRIELLALQLHQTMTSRSWKLTAPLRSSARFLKKGLKSLVPVIRLDGRRTVGASSERNVPGEPPPRDESEPPPVSHSCPLKPGRTTISLLVPVNAGPPRHLREMLDSVLAQCYADWRLCLAVAASPDPSTAAVLEDYRRKDSRIAVFPGNGDGPAGAFQTALKTAKGDFVALLDSRDILPPFSLCAAAEAVSDRPTADVLYSDEDTVDEDGRRTDRFLKPGWSPEYLHSTNYLGRLCLFRREAIVKAGGFRENFESVADYDIALRLTAGGSTVVHIPKVLYHRRKHDPTVGLDGKPQAGRRALQEALNREGEGGIAEIHPDDPGCFLARYPPPSGLISIIIPTRDQPEALDRCLSSIHRKSRGLRYEIICLDNGSRERKTWKIFRNWERTLGDRFRVESMDMPFNYSALNNRGVASAGGEYVVLLNDDTEILTEGGLAEMAGYAARRDIGAVGAHLFYPDDTLQHAGVILGLFGNAGHGHRGYPRNHPGYFSRLRVVANYAAVTGACLMVRTELYRRVGGMEESLGVAFNDIDLCLKFHEKGYRNVVLPFVQVRHVESLSRGPENTPVKQRRFLNEGKILRAKWPGLIRDDPYYHPGLTRMREDFSPKGPHEPAD